MESNDSFDILSDSVQVEVQASVVIALYVNSEKADSGKLLPLY